MAAAPPMSTRKNPLNSANLKSFDKVSETNNTKYTILDFTSYLVASKKDLTAAAECHARAAVVDDVGADTGDDHPGYGAGDAAGAIHYAWTVNWRGQGLMGQRRG